MAINKNKIKTTSVSGKKNKILKNKRSKKSNRKTISSNNKKNKNSRKKINSKKIIKKSNKKNVIKNKKYNVSIKSKSKKKKNITKIKIVGIGGCGGNIATRLYESFPRGVEVIVINTDLQDLSHTRAHKKLYIGRQTTRGLGAGMDPEIGMRSAEENREEISQALNGADIVFLSAGFGGGTGSGALPVIAEIAKEMGILTVAIITKPFSFEGVQRTEIANNAIAQLRDKVDTFILVSNDKIFSIINENTPILKAFSVIDDILKNAVIGISELILNPGIINVDFADIKYIMKNSGSAIIGVGIGSGKNRALAAANSALNSPLLDTNINGAKGLLFSISGRRDVKMNEINEIAKIVSESVDSGAKIIFGAYYDRKVPKGKIKVTLIATGFGSGYMKNSTLFEGVTDELFESGVIFDSTLNDSQDDLKKEVDNKNKKNNDSENSKEINNSNSNNENENEDYQDDSIWDIPAFLRKKNKKNK